MEFETLRYEANDGVVRVTLNRPEVHNAFDSRMLAEFREVWQTVRADPTSRVVIVTGAGDQAFCTGIDRTEAMGTGAAPPAADRNPFVFDDPGNYLGPKSNDVWRPIIASVNGMACGGAFYLLGEADIIIAAEGATFFDPHVTYGMASAYESIHMLPRLPIGELLRMQLLGNNERMSARRAHEIGLVSEVVPREQLVETADWLARAIASQPPLAVEATVRAIWDGLELSHRQALDGAYSYVRLANSPESIRQGQEQFAARQRPPWRLR